MATAFCGIVLTGCTDSAVSSNSSLQGNYEEATKEEYSDEGPSKDVETVDEAVTEADDNDQDSSTPEHSESFTVSADYLEDVKGQYPDYMDASESMHGNRTDYETMILFHTDGDVEDFRVFSLELNIDEDGNVDYTPTEVFSATELKRDAPIAVPLSFPGDMSLNGFCYKGSDGNLKTFIIGISGMDGSLWIDAENFDVP